MTLAGERLKQVDSPSLTEGGRVLLRCRIAAEFIHAGQYEAAGEALGELWPGVGERPEVEGMQPDVVAEVLLQCGAMTGLLGSSQNVSGAQERAKDLLAEAVASGSVVGAARLLGLKHQTFTSMLQARHQKLLSKRRPREKRLRSIVKAPEE